MITARWSKRDHDFYTKGEIKVYWQRTATTKRPRLVANIWLNDAKTGRSTWHTWDKNGTGGENSCNDGLHTTVDVVLASLLVQGFVPSASPEDAKAMRRAYVAATKDYPELP